MKSEAVGGGRRSREEEAALWERRPFEARRERKGRELAGYVEEEKRREER